MTSVHWPRSSTVSPGRRACRRNPSDPRATRHGWPASRGRFHPPKWAASSPTTALTRHCWLPAVCRIHPFWGIRHRCRGWIVGYPAGSPCGRGSEPAEGRGSPYAREPKRRGLTWKPPGAAILPRRTVASGVPVMRLRYHVGGCAPGHGRSRGAAVTAAPSWGIPDEPDHRNPKGHLMLRIGSDFLVNPTGASRASTSSPPSLSRQTTQPTGTKRRTAPTLSFTTVAVASTT